MPLYCPHYPLPSGFNSVVQLTANPYSQRNCLNCSDIIILRSEWLHAKAPKRANKKCRHFINKFLTDISREGYANGNSEYLSIIAIRYMFLVFDSRGHLKFIFILSKD